MPSGFVHVLTDAGYGDPAAFAAGDQLTSEVFPDLRVVVDDVLASATPAPSPTPPRPNSSNSRSGAEQRGGGSVEGGGQIRPTLSTLGAEGGGAGGGLAGLSTGER